MPITAQMHDGTRLEFPDGTDPTVIQKTVQSLLANKQVAAPDGTAPSELKGSAAGGFWMGLRDPIDAGAQLLDRGLKSVGVDTDAISRGVNAAAKKVLPNAVADMLFAAKPVDEIVKTANSEYDASRKMASRDGIDIARIAGNIANPVNRIVPMAGASSTAAVGARAGLQGAISGLATPVTDTDNFAQQKLTQAGVGTAFGALGGVILDKLVQGAGNVWAQMRAKPGFPQLLGGPAGDIPASARTEMLLQQAAANQGIDLSQIPQSIMTEVRGQVEKAIKAGKDIDAKSLMRSAEGKAVLGEDAGLLLGQATRDPMQFADELNIRGIQNAGKPIADRLNLQNTRLIEAVGKQGAKGAPDAYDAGKAATASLQRLDDKLSKGVTADYTAFRNASGSTVDVPLQPLAQRVGEVLDTFGRENVPAAVLRRLNEYGLLGAKQTKVFDLLEADKLIKTINANLDPLKGSEAKALGELRKGLSESIDMAATQSEGATGPASDLLKRALASAKARFKLHEDVPALEDAVKNPKAQERFVRDYITSKTAPIDTVGRLVGLLEPEALDGVRRNVLQDILEGAAPGAARGSDAALFSQAGFNRSLDRIGDRKLQILFGDDGLAQLRQVGRVAEWIQKQPKGSAVNNSGTAGAVMNLMQGLAGKSENPLLNKLTGLPGLNLARNSLRQSLDEQAASRALAAKAPIANPQLTPEEVATLRRFLPQAGGAFGVAAAGGVR